MAEFQKNEKVLYALVNDPRAGPSSWTDAEILDIHRDDTPAYYTISYYMLEAVEDKQNRKG
jgi:hypothetical protein